jgi:ParB-like chromosome segregation protein Spo0J
MKTKAELKAHELSKLFPPMNNDEFHRFADDLKQHGLLNEIVLLDGQILDGVHRYKACKLAGVEPKYRKFNGKDGSPLEYVMAQNLHRRHLTASQRAAIAAEVANIKQGQFGRRHEKAKAQTRKNTCLTSEAQAAKQLNVGVAYVQRAKKVKREAPEIFEKVKAGKMTVHRALGHTNSKIGKKGKTAVSAGSGKKERTTIAPIASKEGAPLSQHSGKTDLWDNKRFKKRDKQMAKRYRIALQLNEFSRTVDGVDWTKAPAIAKRAYEQGYIDGTADMERGSI